MASGPGPRTGLAAPSRQRSSPRPASRSEPAAQRRAAARLHHPARPGPRGPERDDVTVARPGQPDRRRRSGRARPLGHLVRVHLSGDRDRIRPSLRRPPLSRRHAARKGGLVAAKVLATLAVLTIQVVVLSALGLALGWHPDAAGVLRPSCSSSSARGPSWPWRSSSAEPCGPRPCSPWPTCSGCSSSPSEGSSCPARNCPTPSQDSSGCSPRPRWGTVSGPRSSEGTLNLPALLVVLGWAGAMTLPAARLFRFDD